MNTAKLANTLDLHKKWLRDETGGQRAELYGANLSGANLSGANLRGAHLSGADLSGADLSGANLRGANLSGANLRGADLSGANLRRADLSGADLSGADLSGADLSGAELYGANLRRAALSGANLRGANLYRCAGDCAFIKSLFVTDVYPITYTAETLQIGCQRYPIADWWLLDDPQIVEMDGKTALTFWREWKDTIRMIIEKSPAKPTGAENKEESEK